MERQFFSGNTLEQAVLAAARHHDLDPDQVAYKLRDKKHGFVNIRRRVVIEVDPAAPEQSADTPIEREAALPDSTREQASARHSVDLRSGTPLGSQSEEDRQYPQDQRNQLSWRGEDRSWVGGDQADTETKALEKAIEELSDLVGSSAQSSIQRDGEGFDIELSGADSEFLRENRGSGLGAIEHLLPRIVRGLNGRGVLCRVDSEGFRAAHEQELERLALDTAGEVSREGEERRLEPMNPAERRVIHVSLADDPTVRTESEGQGYLKRVRIVPA